MSEYFLYNDQVFYEDTDAGGRVYHSKYLNFAERARTAWLAHLNIDQKNLLTLKKVAFVVHSIKIDFTKPLKIFDKFTVKTSIAETAKTSIRLKQDIFFNDNLAIISAKLDVVIVMISLERERPIRIPEEILSAF